MLNGPPASGKSTLARRYAEDHPLALVVDVDVVRSWLGRWTEHPPAAGRAARALTTAMVRTHLASGHDVVVAQLYGRTDHLDELAAVAREAGADHHEVVLTASPDDTVTRYRSRTTGSTIDVHGPSASDADLVDLHTRVGRVAASRPTTIEVEPVWGDVDASYARLRQAIGPGGTGPEPHE